MGNASLDKVSARLKELTERFDTIEKEFKNVSIALNITQSLQKQITDKVLIPVQNDLRHVIGLVEGIQYTIKAMGKVLNLDEAKVNEVFSKLRIEDFDAKMEEMNKASGSFIKETVETTNDVVVITSTTPGMIPDQGVLRSRMTVGQFEPNIAEKLIGKKATDTFELTLNDIQHTFTILNVYECPLPAVEEAPQPTNVGLHVVSPIADEPKCECAEDTCAEDSFDEIDTVKKD